ncbi:MAG: dihydropteroate synthase, partial [Beijerinckiaceae bacterium]|nr:dihydropteroate synthase [Beijerinckiaceae bacterium]
MSSEPLPRSSAEIGKHPLIMGIVNVTPDSFSDGGRFFDSDKAVAHALQLAADGADILDVGGESTRPGFDPVDGKEEISRVIPVISAICRQSPVPVSIDTMKAETAAAALAAGATIINDVWGFQFDRDMARVAADGQVQCILMH